MADPLSITASIISVSGLAISSVQTLTKTIDSIKDSLDILKYIRSDLNAITPVLQKLEEAAREDNRDKLLYEEIAPAVKNCERACTAFRLQLEHWTRHSNTKSGALADRWKVGMFGQERIQALRTQLSDCKGTLNVALSTATFIAMAKAEDDLDDRAVILQSREQSLQQKLARAEREGIAIESNIQQLAIIPKSPSDDDEQSRQELLQEVRYQKASNEAFRKACEEAVSQLSYERTGHKIRGTKAKDHSNALAGIINPTGGEIRVNLDIVDTWAENSSFAGAGIINNFDFSTVSQNSSQVLKTRSSSGQMGNNEALS